MNNYIEPLYTPKQVANYLGIGINTMYKMLNSEKIKAVRVNERKWKIPRSCLREYIAKEAQMNMSLY